jgi:ABC-type sugar transport system permease subunit
MANIAREQAQAQSLSTRLTTFFLGPPLGRQERAAGLLMTLPALVFFIIFIGIPIVRTLLLGLMEWNAIGPAEWVGLDNYLRMGDDAVFRGAFVVTLLLTGALTLCLTVFPLLIAVLFNMGWGVLGTIGRTMLFMPAIISWVVTGALWKLIFDPHLGTLNNLLAAVGLEALQQNWLGDPRTVLWSIGVVTIWQQLGLYVIIYYAGLQGLDISLLEAAAIDGANSRQQFLNVTVPLLRPVILMVITLNLLNGIKLFDVIYVMTGGGPVNASQVLGTYMYRVAFANPGLPEFGYGSALSTVIMTLCIFAVFFQIWMNRRSNV